MFMAHCSKCDTGIYIKDEIVLCISCLKKEIQEFRKSLEWYRDNIDRSYANGFLNHLDRIQKLYPIINQSN